MENQQRNRKRQKHDFSHLLAKCMAKALFTLDKKGKQNQTTLHDQHYQNTISRLKRDLLLDNEREGMR